MPAPLLRLENVGKDYARITRRSGHLRLLYQLLRKQPPVDCCRALHDVSFELRAGESLGVIGENGAGKSTLLKIIAGVIPPTRGRVAAAGRITALLELGSGFHPEYSGMENIRLAGSLAGLGEREIMAKREQIIDFADIGEQIHQPIKTYSSGMVVRLGFAVATAVRPEILVTDEVLAVGDESFQKKCVAWQQQYLQSGGTLLLCSHSMYHVQKLCRKALWIHQGRVQRQGPASDVTTEYLVHHEEKSSAERRRQIEPRAARAKSHVVIGLELHDGAERIQTDESAESAPFRHLMGHELLVRGELYSPEGPPPAILIDIVRVDGTSVYSVTSELDRYRPTRSGAHRYCFEIGFPELPLLPGKYTVRAHALGAGGTEPSDPLERPLLVEGATREFGMCRLEHHWGDRVAEST
jgi:lipopolysaccharide transport system ATP-binding protein